MKVTPMQALGWAFVALIIAYLAMALGQTLMPYDTHMFQFVIGTLALLIAGHLGSAIAERFRKAIRGS